MSSSSGRSNHSLCSKGAVDATELVFAEKSTQRKSPAKWTEDEECAFVLFLKDQTAAAGDGVNFQKKHFHDASLHLKATFPVQQGGEKTAGACQLKWTSVR